MKNLMLICVAVNSCFMVINFAMGHWDNAFFNFIVGALCGYAAATHGE